MLRKKIRGRLDRWLQSKIVPRIVDKEEPALTFVEEETRILGPEVSHVRRCGVVGDELICYPGGSRALDGSAT